MNIDGKAYRTIWIDQDDCLWVINQKKLPHCFELKQLLNFVAVCEAIRDMTVRGAGLIGAAAGYGMWLAAREGVGLSREAFERHMAHAGEILKATRPTANNLAWAVERILRQVRLNENAKNRVLGVKQEAMAIADEDAESGRQIGIWGKKLLETLAAGKNPGEPVRILTHCNAGWLAFVDYGSALAPVYAAHDAGISVHVWVDETRPRNQGANLTAWELMHHGVPHSLVVDNAGGHLMQQGLVDILITGADRVTRRGDAANKIGTYLKALAAYDNGIPFYVALPSSTFDFSMDDGLNEIPIEERAPDEVRWISGQCKDGTCKEVLICPPETPACNWSFDVTPARLITGLICERGICAANEAGIKTLFPEYVP